jgi:hypothetical protein
MLPHSACEPPPKEREGTPHNHAGVDPDSDFAAAACRRVLDAQHHGVLVAGTDGRILNASAPQEALFGYLRGMLNGRRAAGLLPSRTQPSSRTAIGIGDRRQP